jgi:hypothetical protein
MGFIHSILTCFSFYPTHGASSRHISFV